jgi:L-lactate dehydrogenase complex protein LldG
MSTARDQILGSIRKSIGREALSGEDAAKLHEKLARPPRNLIPDRTDLDHDGQVALFKDKVLAAACSVSEVSSMDEVPKALSDWLGRENLAARVIQSPALSGDLDWSETPTLEVKTGMSDGTDETSLTPIFAGVAETGTLMLQSDESLPTSLNFLPENHVVIVKESQIVGPLEDAWARLRAARTAAPDTMPRTVNLITGPSRTGDIEQKIQMGAHGPRRLHVILVRD